MTPADDEGTSATLAPTLVTAVGGASAAPPSSVPLRVAFEQTLLELTRTGGARAAVELAAALERRADVELLPVAHPAGTGALGRTRLGRHRIVRGLAREAAWLPHGVARAAARSGADLLHLPASMSVPVGGLPVVMTIHDTFPWERPEWCSAELRLQHRLRVTPGLRRVTAILVPSQWTAERVVDRLGVDPETIHIAPYAAARAFFAAPADEPFSTATSGVPGPYVLGVGTAGPRKNLRGLLAAFDTVVRAGLPHHLVLVGTPAPSPRRFARMLDAIGAPARERVHHRGWVGDDDLAALYRNADAFALAALGEGFGLPVLEAMASGTPVVALAAGSVPEVAGGAAELADPAVEGALGDALTHILEARGHRERLVRRGRERAADFSWERTAELTRDAYTDALLGATA